MLRFRSTQLAPLVLFNQGLRSRPRKGPGMGMRLTEGRDQLHAFHNCTVEQGVLLRDVLGDFLRPLGDFGSECILEGWVGCKLTEQGAEDGRADVDVGKENLIECVKKLRSINHPSNYKATLLIWRHHPTYLCLLHLMFLIGYNTNSRIL